MPPPYRRALTRVLALTLAVASVTLLGPVAPSVADDIPRAPGHRLVGDYQGAPVTASPVPGQAPPRHPYLAPNGRSGMHADAAGSGTHPYSGPLGRNPEVASEKIAPVGGECATATFDATSRLITVCGTFTGFLLKLLDPRTLDTLAECKLPQRSSTVEAITTLDFAKMFKDTSGGAYFYLDDQDRVVLADSRRTSCGSPTGRRRTAAGSSWSRTTGPSPVRSRTTA